MEDVFQNQILFMFIELENISFENIKVFPNPFTNHLYINGINNSIAKIVIHSIEGKILKELVPKDSETIVKTNDLAEGIYIVRLQLTNNEIINYKTIKIKR
jgi:hypothetical protein